MEKFFSLCNGLDWNLPLEKQNETIEKLLENISENDIKILINRNFEKKYWDNASIILYKTDNRLLKKFVPDLLEWLQDMNWPGFDNIIITLLKIGKLDVLPHISKALMIAESRNDYLWITGIKQLFPKIGIEEKDFANKKIYEIIYKAEW
jgi:hypothetical protein